MTTATHNMTVSRTDLYNALVECERQADSSSHWCAVRVAADGSVYNSEEPSRCVGEDEYYHRMPHTVTVFSRNGSGQCDLPEDWSDDDGVLLKEVESCVEQLEEAGYNVTLTD